jgi:hypothetical protein
MPPSYLQRLADLGLLLEDAAAILGADHSARELLGTLGAALLEAANAPSSEGAEPQLPTPAPT